MFVWLEKKPHFENVKWRGIYHTSLLGILTFIYFMLIRQCFFLWRTEASIISWRMIFKTYVPYWHSFIVISRLVSLQAKTYFRSLKKKFKRLKKTQLHLKFNEICIKDCLLPKYTSCAYIDINRGTWSWKHNRQKRVCKL